MGTVANITTGPSNIFVAADTGTFPAFTGSPTDFTGAGFVVPGFTQDGIEWDYTPTWKDLMVDEKLAPAKKIITAHKLIVSAKLAETTLQNLAYAIAAATFNGTDTLTIGSLDQAPEFTLGWLGPCAPAPARTTQGTRQAIFYRGGANPPTKAPYQRKDMSVYNVQFEALDESSQPTAADLAT